MADCPPTMMPVNLRSSFDDRDTLYNAVLEANGSLAHIPANLRPVFDDRDVLYSAFVEASAKASQPATLVKAPPWVDTRDLLYSLDQILCNL